MLILFIILIIVSALVLGLIVLIQNPKGGGLAGSLAGFSNQFMGVKQTTDVLEKGTWVFAAVVGVLCLLSPMFIPKNAAPENKLRENLNTKSSPTAPATTPQQPPAGTTGSMPGTGDTIPKK